MGKEKNRIFALSNTYVVVSSPKKTTEKVMKKGSQYDPCSGQDIADFEEKPRVRCMSRIKKKKEKKKRNERKPLVVGDS